MNFKRIILKILLLLIGFGGFFWFALPLMLVGILNIGNFTGLIVCGCTAIYGLFMSIINNIIARLLKKRVYKILLSIIAVFASLALILVITFSALMINAALNKPKEPSTVVVLGCRVYSEHASLMLTERLNAAYEYLTENPEQKCILSGGQGPGESISEAECMYRYLIERGISADRLFKEEKSTSTRENLAFSKKILDERYLNKNVTIITNEFHEYRAAKIANSLGITAYAVSARTHLFLLPTYYVRELYGILYEILL